MRVTVFLSEKLDIQITEQVKHLLICLRERPQSVKEAMKNLGLNHRPTFIYDYLKPAMSLGFAEMTEPDSPNSPKQKYRLTGKGKAFLSLKNEDINHGRFEQ
ncbi:MAG: hypothetical protein Q7J09_08800 [Methanocalculus sp.]|uniref:Fic family protein n=1 Tax=Methanocalculus sp. TaxID=2004547 RepID=UPI0027260BC6|nr:hypothetical protein [Methanocalculus sp.]MDO9540083.1 hypothetical protein [Methanocalculus sp.]